MNIDDVHKAKDPRERPGDPAGTQPRHDPESLLPTRRESEPHVGPGLWRAPDPVEAGADDDALVAGGPEHPRGALVQRDHGTVPGAEPTGAEVEDELAAVEAATHRHEPAGVGAGAESISDRAASRIRLVVAGLLAIAVVGLGSAALIAFGPDEATGPSGPAWSQWRPDGNANERVATIADRVGREYRGAGGSQLVVVTGGPLEAAGLPLTVALRESAADGGDVQLAGGKGVLYRLCGLGDKCSIATGKPSVERHLLLRREALELALYTLHYTDADQVVVFMPPPKGKSPDEALFFRRSDLEPQLSRPLQKSLVPTTPSVASVTRSPDARFVQSLTLQTLFKFSLTQANSDSRAFLVLDPIS